MSNLLAPISIDAIDRFKDLIRNIETAGALDSSDSQLIRNLSEEGGLRLRKALELWELLLLSPLAYAAVEFVAVFTVRICDAMIQVPARPDPASPEGRVLALLMTEHWAATMRTVATFQPATTTAAGRLVQLPSHDEEPQVYVRTAVAAHARLLARVCTSAMQAGGMDPTLSAAVSASVLGHPDVLDTLCTAFLAHGSNDARHPLYARELRGVHPLPHSVAEAARLAVEVAAAGASGSGDVGSASRVELALVQCLCRPAVQRMLVGIVRACAGDVEEDGAAACIHPHVGGNERNAALFAFHIARMWSILRDRPRLLPGAELLAPAVRAAKAVLGGAHGTAVRDPTVADALLDSLGAPDAHICATCFTADGKLLVCGRCGWARYCCKQCQTRHWPAHRLACKKAG